jgi:holliday junction DNA helicase RuvA
MIHHIKGKLVEIELTHAVVDINGLGYFINIPMSTYDHLPRAGSDVALRTVMIVREDDTSLFGFSSEEERTLFKLLLSVSGIGAKTALTVLSSLPVGNFCTAVANSEVKIISKINGIGKKTAERLVLELRDKVATLLAGNVVSGGVEMDVDASDTLAVNDAILALETLGYRPDKIRQIVKIVVDKLDPPRTSDNIIRKALAELNT